MGTITYYIDAAGEWRWRLEAANHEPLADGGEGYKNKADCVNGFHAVCNLVQGNPALVRVVFEDTLAADV